MRLLNLRSRGINEQDTIMEFIEWLEEEKNVYLVDLYYPKGGGRFDNLDDVRKLVDEYADIP